MTLKSNGKESREFEDIIRHLSYLVPDVDHAVKIKKILERSKKLSS